MNICIFFAVILTIMGLVSCSTAITDDPRVEVVFANNRVIETAIKSIEQTSSWSEGDTFGAYGTESALSTFSFMNQNTAVSFSDLNGWDYDVPAKWPDRSQEFTFFAYFPYVSEGSGIPTLTDDDSGRFNLEYGVKETVKLQEDLLWDWIIDASKLLPSGQSTTEGNSNNTSFVFQHALSKIKFRIKADSPQTIYITSLSLTAYGNGIFSTIRTDGHLGSAATTPTWETIDPLMTFSVIDEFVPNTDKDFGYMADTELRDIGFVITNKNESDADYEALMIPQAKTDIKIRLTYNIVNHYTIGHPVTKEIVKEFSDIDFQYDWSLGLQYIYDISIVSEEATLTTTVGTWDEFSNAL